MANSIPDDLEELLAHGVIHEEEAARIRNYYLQKPSPQSNRLLIVFGILGALLVGMGLVLIIAHNWDILPKFIKLSVGLLPMIVGQVLCGYQLFKKSASVAWREGTSVFLVLTIALAIAIVSQVYNIEGDLDSFLFAWMLLSLPVIYVMQSSAASLLYWIGITAYVCEADYFTSSDHSLSAYWLLALAALPWYWQLTRHRNTSNFIALHHWVIVGSVSIALGSFAHQTEELIIPAYFFLFGLFIFTGQFPFISKRNLVSNAYLIVGSLGMITILLLLSFDFYWREILTLNKSEWFFSTEFIVCSVLLLLAVVQFIRLLKYYRISELLSKSYVIPVFIILFVLGIQLPHLAQVLTNILLLVLAVYTIREGAKADHLLRMNYGLLILTLLIICRFFDTDLSFVMRGLLFVMVGLGFFGMNYWIVRKRKGRSV